MTTEATATKPNASSQILAAVHETATDLCNAGFIDARRMRHYDALCLNPIPAYSSECIRALRDRHKLNHAVSPACSTPACRPCGNGRLAQTSTRAVAQAA